MLPVCGRCDHTPQLPSTACSRHELTNRGVGATSSSIFAICVDRFVAQARALPACLPARLCTSFRKCISGRWASLSRTPPAAFSRRQLTRLFLSIRQLPASWAPAGCRPGGGGLHGERTRGCRVCQRRAARLRAAAAPPAAAARQVRGAGRGAGSSVAGLERRVHRCCQGCSS